jgi:hypothetical protein
MTKCNFIFKNLVFLVLTFVLINFYTNTSKAAPVQLPHTDSLCSASPITQNAANTAEDACEMQPTTQKVKFFKLDLCTTKPTAPIAAAAVIKTTCSDVFTNAAGSEVSIAKGVGSPLNGTFNDPPYGTYTWAYIEISPTLKYTASATFNGIRKDPDPARVVTLDNAICWTITGNAFNAYGSTEGIPNPRVINCGNALGTIGEESLFLNSFFSGADDGLDARSTAASFLATNGSLVEAYLVDNTGKLVPSANVVLDAASGVSKVIILMPINLTITPDTTGYNIKWNNTRGIKPYFTLTTGLQNPASTEIVDMFGIAYFDFDLTVF